MSSSCVYGLFGSRAGCGESLFAGTNGIYLGWPLVYNTTRYRVDIAFPGFGCVLTAFPKPDTEVKEDGDEAMLRNSLGPVDKELLIRVS